MSSTAFDAACVAIQQLVCAVSESPDDFFLVRPDVSSMTAQDLACSSSGCFPEIEVAATAGSSVILKAQAVVRPHRRLIVFGKLNEANSLLRTFEVELGRHTVIPQHSILNISRLIILSLRQLLLRFSVSPTGGTEISFYRILVTSLFPRVP
jgi:hypothetical protein